MATTYYAQSTNSWGNVAWNDASDGSGNQGTPSGAYGDVAEANGFTVTFYPDGNTDGVTLTAVNGGRFAYCAGGSMPPAFILACALRIDINGSGVLGAIQLIAGAHLTFANNTWNSGLANLVWTEGILEIEDWNGHQFPLDFIPLPPAAGILLIAGVRFYGAPDYSNYTANSVVASDYKSNADVAANYNLKTASVLLAAIDAMTVVSDTTIHATSGDATVAGDAQSYADGQTAQYNADASAVGAVKSGIPSNITLCGVQGTGPTYAQVAAAGGSVLRSGFGLGI